MQLSTRDRSLRYLRQELYILILIVCQTMLWQNVTPVSWLIRFSRRRRVYYRSIFVVVVQTFCGADSNYICKWYEPTTVDKRQWYARRISIERLLTKVGNKRELVHETNKDSYASLSRSKARRPFDAVQLYVSPFSCGSYQFPEGGLSSLA